MSTKKRIWSCLLSSLLLLLFAVAAIMSHEEDEQEKTISQEEIAQKLGEERIARQDSLFSVVNENYLLIKPIFQKRCFDCHSQFTDYPWYYKLPLIKGMIDDDIKEARKHLDLSNDFPFPGRGNILEITRQIKEEIEENDMPLLSYRLMHWGTTIEGAQRDSVFNWVDESMKMIIEFYEAEKIPYELREEDDD